MNITSTTSPGIMRSMKKTSTATPSSVGIVSRMPLADIAEHDAEVVATREVE